MKKVGIIICLTITLLTGSAFSAPVTVNGDSLPRAKKIVTEGGASVWTIMDNGEVYVSGDDYSGTFGLGNAKASITTPTRIEGLKDVDIVDVVVDYGFAYEYMSTYYLTDKGEVYVSGNNECCQLGLGHSKNVYTVTKVDELKNIKVKKVVSNDLCSVYYLTEDGKVYANGANACGQLALGHVSNVMKPTKVDSLDHVKIKDIVVNEGKYKFGVAVEPYVLFLAENGEIYVAGSNEDGILGVGHTNNVTKAEKVNSLEGIKVKKVKIDGTLDEGNYSSNRNSIQYIDEAGDVYLSEGGKVNKIKGLEGKKVKEIFGKCFYLTEDSKLYGVFNGQAGELTGIMIPKDIDISKIISRVDGNVFYYLTKDGAVYSHGRNDNGQLGLGHTNTIQIVNLAQKITALDGIKIKDIVVDLGGTKAFFLADNGDVYMAGDNGIGIKVYNYDLPGYSSPSKIEKASKIPDLANVKEIIISDNSSSIAFLTESGMVYVCGNNESGQLGLGHTEKVSTLTRVNKIIREENNINVENGIFKDVAADRWSSEAIKFVIENKLMSEVEEGIFNPTGVVSRQDLAIVLNNMRLDREVSIKDEYANFKDDQDMYKLSKEIRNAIRNVGIYIQPNYKAKFEPTVEMTRREVALSITRALVLHREQLTQETKKKIKEIVIAEGMTMEKDVDKNNPVDANKIMDGALEEAVGAMIQLGIMQGDENGRFNFDSKVTREQLAKFIINVYNADIKEGEKCTEKNCNGYLKWEFAEEGNYAGKHRQMCTEGHLLVKYENHSYGENMTCKKCGYKEENIDGLASLGDVITGEITTEGTTTEETTTDENIAPVESDFTCSKCDGETFWEATSTMHVSMCKANSSHIIIEGHTLENNKCAKCGYVDNNSYTSIFDDYQDSKHWAWQNVCSLAEKGIVKGTLDEKGMLKLYPQEKITAEAFIALTSRIMGYDKSKLTDEEVYMPIDEDRWSSGEWRFLLQKLGKNGKYIIQDFVVGDKPTKTDAEVKTNIVNPVTREKAAYLLGTLLPQRMRSNLVEAEENAISKFEDWNKVTPRFKQDISLLSFCDILRGNQVIENDKVKYYVDPDTELTREQAIALIDRFNSLMTVFGQSANDSEF